MMKYPHLAKQSLSDINCEMHPLRVERESELFTRCELLWQGWYLPQHVQCMNYANALVNTGTRSGFFTCVKPLSESVSVRSIEQLVVLCLLAYFWAVAFLHTYTHTHARTRARLTSMTAQCVMLLRLPVTVNKREEWRGTGDKIWERKWLFYRRLQKTFHCFQTRLYAVFTIQK